jgi:hypothetical protein
MIGIMQLLALLRVQDGILLFFGIVGIILILLDYEESMSLKKWSGNT